MEDSNKEKQKIAVIIGAGPAGLTAAYELVKKSNIRPVVIEADNIVGGISRTVNYKGNRIDIGGHRFFSKSDRVMNWWLNIMPLQNQTGESEITLNYHNNEKKIKNTANKDKMNDDNVMLLRSRLSRIYYNKKFFDYPISLSAKTLINLGFIKSAKIAFAYVIARIFPRKPEKNLEDFFINRFGTELYRTFFKDYTEKVWGFDCKDISPDWGRQRIKGISLSKAIVDAMKRPFMRTKSDFRQKGTETSLIQRFMYPKLGPGQLWERVAEIIKEDGAEIIMKSKAIGISMKDGRVDSVLYTDQKGKKNELNADYVISTMPVKELIRALPNVPKKVLEVSDNLVYRDFITAGILLKKMSVKSKGRDGKTGRIPDNWIYIQEPGWKVARIQVFNNWSPYMVKDEESNVWIGMEYMANEGDELWSMKDDDFRKFAVSELKGIGLAKEEDVIDATVIRMKKAYPSYVGVYKDFSRIRDYVNKIPNLFLIGRNGMHKYNNQDHSMLTAMAAADDIITEKTDKKHIWKINTEEEYHEKK